jgi:hypothetical protein
MSCYIFCHDCHFRAITIVYVVVDVVTVDVDVVVVVVENSV